MRFCFFFSVDEDTYGVFKISGDACPVWTGNQRELRASRKENDALRLRPNLATHADLLRKLPENRICQGKETKKRKTKSWSTEGGLRNYQREDGRVQEP